jgi:hypothetical protein
MNLKDRQVRIRQEEIDSLFNLKSLVDDKELLASYAAEYHKLAWVSVALNARDGADLEVDFGERQEIWLDSLWKSDLTGPKTNLAVRTGKRSRLVVLEVATGQGEAILDQYGEWRAQCVAVLGTSRERHFYAWPPSPIFDLSSIWVTPEFKWFGEGQVVLAPPSFDPEMGETWRWLCPPWDNPPQYPSQAVGRFFLGQISRESQARPVINLSWQEIYCLTSPHKALLQALSASLPLMEDYYQGVLQAAVEAGLKTPELLFPLLWHAPRGDARQVPERWTYLQKLVLDAQGRGLAATSRGDLSNEVLLDNGLSYAPEYPAGRQGERAAKPGLPDAVKSRLAGALQPGPAPRHPFSSRKTGKYSRGQ